MKAGAEEKTVDSRLPRQDGIYRKLWKIKEWIDRHSLQGLHRLITSCSQNSERASGMETAPQ